MALLKKLLPDLLLVAGAASVVCGATLIYTPAGYIAAGVIAIYAGLRL